MNIVRAAVFHTPRNAFSDTSALEAYPDGALAVENGRVLACGDYGALARAYPAAAVRDLRGGYILPGFIDTHVHYPQVRVLGGLGYSLLDWLEQLTLPEEARMADAVYAEAIAREFVGALASHGTTTALVFGSHFFEAMATLFTTAEQRGLRIFSGLVMADKALRPELHSSPENAYRESRSLIERFDVKSSNGKSRMGYVVTPRFALSASANMLEVCQTLLRENAGLRFTTHINENPEEIERVARLFPERDYLSVYERFNLVGRNSVLAHNIYTTEDQLRRLACHGASIAHCPCSNAALGSGIFPMKRHLAAGVRFALGTDVGGGTGFGMLKESLQSYLMQRVATQPMTLTPAQLLYLATRAGAEALNLTDETGDFEAGKAADFVYLRPPAGGVLEGALKRAEDPAQTLTALFTLAGAESVREVRVADNVVFDGRN